MLKVAWDQELYVINAFSDCMEPNKVQLVRLKPVRFKVMFSGKICLEEPDGLHFCSHRLMLHNAMTKNIGQYKELQGLGKDWSYFQTLRYLKQGFNDLCLDSFVAKRAIGIQ